MQMMLGFSTLEIYVIRINAIKEYFLANYFRDTWYETRTSNTSNVPKIIHEAPPEIRETSTPKTNKLLALSDSGNAVSFDETVQSFLGTVGPGQVVSRQSLASAPVVSNILSAVDFLFFFKVVL